MHSLMHRYAPSYPGRYLLESYLWLDRYLARSPSSPSKRSSSRANPAPMASSSLPLRLPALSARFRSS